MFVPEEELRKLDASGETADPPKEEYQMSSVASIKKELDNDIEGFVGEMNEESTKVDDQEFDVEVPDFEPEQAAPSSVETRAAETTSEFIVKTADGFITQGLASYARTDASNLESAPDKVKEIAKHFSPYFISKSAQMPPWVMGIIAVIFLLFDKFKAATAIRKANLETEKHKARVSQLEQEIETLKREKQIKNLKKEVGELRIVT